MPCVLHKTEVSDTAAISKALSSKVDAKRCFNTLYTVPKPSSLAFRCISNKNLLKMTPSTSKPNWVHFLGHHNASQTLLDFVRCYEQNDPRISWSLSVKFSRSHIWFYLMKGNYFYETSFPVTWASTMSLPIYRDAIKNNARLALLIIVHLVPNMITNFLFRLFTFSNFSNDILMTHLLSQSSRPLITYRAIQICFHMKMINIINELFKKTRLVERLTFFCDLKKVQ